MSVEFYNVKKKQKVTIAKDKVEKVTYEIKTKTGKVQTKYAFKAVDDDGTKLTKFASKDAWETL